MAVTVLNSGINQEKGVTYTVTTDSSVDWTGVTNDTYFYDLGDGLVHYKDSTGTVLNMFVSGGGGGSSIYTSDDTIGTGRVVTLTDTLTFVGATNQDGLHVDYGSSSTSSYSKKGLKLTSTDGYESSWNARTGSWTFRGNNPLTVQGNSTTNDVFQVAWNGGGLWKGGTITLGQNTYGKTEILEGGVIRITDITGVGVQHYISRGANNQLSYFYGQGFPGSAGMLFGGTSKVGTEDISLQGDTLVSKKLELSTTDDGFLMPRLTTAQKNAISSPDTNLMVFDTDLSSLQRYNGSAWVAVAAGTGIVQLNQEGSSGDPVFYTDVQSALNAANTSGGDITITLHDNITTTTAISTNATANIDNITFDLNGFTITNTANDSSAVIFNKLQNNIITIINGSIIKTTGTGHALHFSSGIGDLYMSNCYVYSEAGSALRIDASITPINIWELGNSTFKTNTGYGVYLSDALGGISLTNFISISTGSGMACFLNAGGDVTNFKAIAEGTGAALRVRANVTSATNFYAESNSGNCILLESLNPMVKDFTAISVSGYAVFSSASAYKIENFYCKTTSGTRTIQALANSILINGDVFSDSTDCAFIADAERVENVNFTTNSGNYAVLSRFTTNWINCTFRNKDGVAFYNYNSSTSKLKKCTFISEKTSGGSAHAANIVDGASVITFVNCDFEVADSTVNCIKADAAMDMKVANCSFDGSATPLSSNITLNHLESDAFGNVTT